MGRKQEVPSSGSWVCLVPDSGAHGPLPFAQVFLDVVWCYVSIPDCPKLEC